MTELPPADTPSRLNDGRPDRYWVLRGMRAAYTVPGIILIAAFVGFAGLARETGLTMAQTVFMVGVVWALPAKVVLTGSILSGSTLAGAALAVTLSSVRLMPMVVALTPELRAPKTRSWVLYVLSHIIAVTAWVIAMERFAHVPRERRTAFFAGMGATLIATNMAVTAIVFATAGAFPPLLSAALFFITPLYFTTSLWGSARERAGHFAMVLGLALGPVCRTLFPGIDLLVAGIVGGVAAYGLHRAWLRWGKAMTFDAYDAWWWPYLFILIAGWLATDAWRFLGVYLAGYIRPDAEILVLVRALATALVAAVISNLIIFPSGALAAAPLALRIGAAIVSFGVYIAFGRKVWMGALAGEAVLIGGMLALA